MTVESLDVPLQKSILKEHRLEYELRLEYQGIHASIVNIIITSSSFCFRFVLLFFSVALINLLTFGLGGWGGGGGLRHKQPLIHYIKQLHIVHYSKQMYVHTIGFALNN